jgi:hypothetical protein
MFILVPRMSATLAAPPPIRLPIREGRSGVLPHAGNVIRRAAAECYQTGAATHPGDTHDSVTQNRAGWLDSHFRF